MIRLEYPDSNERHFVVGILMKSITGMPSGKLIQLYSPRSGVS
jgi:hypothetical protein